MTQPPLAETLDGRHLVVTGATGFVGKVWLSHLLTHLPGVDRITLLVRKGRAASAAARYAAELDSCPVFRPLRAAHPHDLQAFVDARLEVLDADVSQPLCGLDEATVQRLAASADAVIHLAGLTDFQPDPRKGVPANLDGAVHAADLAARLAVPRLVHVSTCYVAGTRDGLVAEALPDGTGPSGVPVDVAAERAALADLCRTLTRTTDRIDAAQARATRLGWPNLYTYTKGLAEHALAARDDLELTIARPSVVECARSFPFPGWNEGLNTSAPIMWYCASAARRLPATAHHAFDIVPVDAVARQLTVILARHLRGVAAPVHQLSTSSHNPVSFGRIVELTALGARRHAHRSAAGPMERFVAQLDVSPAHADRLGALQPRRLERTARDLRDWLGELSPTERLPRPLRRRLGASLDRRLRSTRRQLGRRARTLGRLAKMLDEYRPFLHDHDWCFSAEHTLAALADLHPDDARFRDDLTDLDWRDYWLNVQYPGVVRWSWPLIDGGRVPRDPPHQPALSLSDATLDARTQGAA